MSKKQRHQKRKGQDMTPWMRAQEKLKPHQEQKEKNPHYRLTDMGQIKSILSHLSDIKHSDTKAFIKIQDEMKRLTGWSFKKIRYEGYGRAEKAIEDVIKEVDES